MVKLSSLRDAFVREAEDDYVGLWQLVKRIKGQLGETEPRAVRRLTLELVRQLLDAGLVPGEPPYKPGGFVPWSERNPDEIIARIEREWDALGREPNIPDVVWFDNPGMKDA